jgi:hypothetical protein
MSNATAQARDKTVFRVSLDTWAVLLALAAAILVRSGVIQRIPW